VANNIIDQALLVRGYGLALRALERRLNFLQFVMRMDNDIMLPMKSVVIPIPSRFNDAEDVTPSSAPVTGEAMLPTSATITLDRWKHKAFAVSDDEQNSLANGVLGAANQAAINSLGRTVVKDVLGAAYRAAYQAVGTPGTVPFATSLDVAGLARRRLNRAGADLMDRFMLLDSDADGAAAILPALNEMQRRGPDAIDTMRTGEIMNTVAGFQFAYNGYLEEAARHGNGTAAPGLYVINGANQAIGNTTIVVQTGALAPTIGTLFTIAGDSQEYVIAGVSTTTNWVIQPPLRVSPAASAVIVIRGAASATGFTFNSLAFGREAIAFASRPDNAVLTPDTMMMEIPDMNSGIVLNLEVSRQNKQTMFDYSIRYGFAIPRPELLVRVFGATE